MRSQEESLPSLGVQHHHAHLASCLADNQHPGDRPVIGLCLDGTGYGQDGAIWGAEILLGDYREYQRLYHLAYIALPGGDLAIREPWRAALSHLERAGLSWDPDLHPVKYARQSSKPGWDLLDLIHKQIDSQVNAPLTSSMGRLFDAVAALIGMRQTVNYEAQAAIELEYLVDPDETWSYPIEIQDQILDPAPLLEALLRDLRAGVKPSILAARFHNSIAEIMGVISIQIRSETGINEVALSGGVWQNMTLLKKSVGFLRKDGFKIYLHHQVPTNDGGIALGQAAIALHQLKL